MNQEPSAPFSRSVDLPPYRAILAVDAKGFTAEPGIAHEAISGLIPQLVGDALSDAGLRDEWDRPAFLGPTGDGFAVGLPSRVLPYLVHPFPRLLQERLTVHNRRIRSGEARLQLRVSVHVGPLVADPQNVNWTGNGKPRNDTHRLLDSKPVRAILAAASPNVTFVACIFSERVFEDVIAAGYTGLHPDQCFEVSAAVEGKAFAQRAWLHVPEISGNLLGIAPGEQPTTVESAGAGSRAGRSATGGVSGPRVRNNSGQVATTVESMTQHRDGAR
jgi:hypothetical protein